MTTWSSPPNLNDSLDPLLAQQSHQPLRTKFRH